MVFIFEKIINFIEGLSRYPGKWWGRQTKMEFLTKN